METISCIRSWLELRHGAQSFPLSTHSIYSLLDEVDHGDFVGNVPHYVIIKSPLCFLKHSYSTWITLALDAF